MKGAAVSRLRSLLPNVLLSGVAVAVTLLAFEVWARMAATPRGKERDERARYTEHDPTLGWRKTPGARAVYVRREYRTEVVINRLGLRDVERSYAAAPGTFRILALGDSYIEGYSVALAETVTQVLERALDRPGCRVEVINGGTTGYSTDQEYLYYVHEGWKFSPQVVVVFFHYNDVLYNGIDRYYRLPKPQLVRSDAGVSLANFPVPPPPTTLAPAAGDAPVRRRVEGSAAWYWLRERLMVGAPRTFDWLGRRGLWDPLGGDGIADELLVYRRRPPPDIQLGWRMTDRILATLRHDVESRGAQLLVAYVPSIMEVSERAWDLTRMRYELPPAAWNREFVWKRLEKSALDGGFALLDLTPALRREDHGVLAEPYFMRDGHWNAVGHRASAEAVRACLSERHWIPECTGGTVAGRPTSGQRVGSGAGVRTSNTMKRRSAKATGYSGRRVRGNGLRRTT